MDLNSDGMSQRDANESWEQNLFVCFFTFHFVNKLFITLFIFDTYLENRISSLSFHQISILTVLLARYKY